MKIVRVATPQGPRYGHPSQDGEIIHLCNGPGPWQLERTGETIAATGARLLAPVLPSKILGVGQNYRAHAKEMGKPIPEQPVLFMKPPTALLDPGAAIRWPRGFERVDFEGELAVVIGRPCRRVSVKDALSVVLGYAVMNDVTVRDLQKRDGQFTRAKGFDTFAPLGPCIATNLDPTDLTIVTHLSGVERQRSSTSDMIFPVAELIACITRVMTLLPGDVITTGTPSGVGPLGPGDRVRIDIEGIGVLENPVLDEEDPTEATP